MGRRLGKVSARIWCARELGNAELLCGEFADYSYDAHTHDKVCLALITRGAIRIRMRSGEFVARSGDLYAIDAEEPHTGWPVDREGWSLRTLYVDASHLQSLIYAGDVATTLAIAGPIIRDQALATLLHDVHRCSEACEPSLSSDERFLAFAARLLRFYSRDAPPPLSHRREPRAVHLARDFLDDHLKVRIRLADIAKAAGLPPFRLLRAFQRATGMTPHRYQRQARIRFATELIRSGHSLGEVAVASGFADQAHLTRCFRYSMGVTPGTYRLAFMPQT